MMEACLAAMKAHKCKLCLLSVKAGNLWAQCYYKRNGFEICRTSGEDGLTYINFSIFINKQVDIYYLRNFSKLFQWLYRCIKLNVGI